MLLLDLLLLLVMQSDVVQNTQVLQEIIFISILSEYFEYADHFIVAACDETVEERHCTIFNHTQHGIFSEDLMLVLHDAINVFHIVWVFLVI